MITKAKRVMTTQLITIPTGSSLHEASQLMEENRIRHLPVADDQQNIIGVISHRDFGFVAEARTIPVDWIMSTPVEAIDENQSLRETVFRMLQKKISCVLVTSQNDEVTGIITTDDLLWHLAHLLRDEKEGKSEMNVAMGLQTIGKVANQLSDMGI